MSSLLQNDTSLGPCYLTPLRCLVPVPPTTSPSLPPWGWHRLLMSQLLLLDLLFSSLHLVKLLDIVSTPGEAKCAVNGRVNPSLSELIVSSWQRRYQLNDNLVLTSKHDIGVLYLPLLNPCPVFKVVKILRVI